MIKIEFPADRKDIALAIGSALQQIATGAAPAPTAHDVAPRHELVDQAGRDDERPVAETVAQPDSTATRVDLKGVAFDGDYCANASEPFYTSGNQKGQWKAKRGLAAGVYESWYTDQLEQVSHSEVDTHVENEQTAPEVETAAAFGAPAQPQAPAGPTDGPSFMGWVSEKQAAGALSQAVITEAWARTGLNVPDLFAPNPPDVVAKNVQALYQQLVAVAGA